MTFEIAKRGRVPNVPGVVECRAQGKAWVFAIRAAAGWPVCDDGEAEGFYRRTGRQL